MIRQAELTRDQQLTADIVWALYTKNRLTDLQLITVIHLLNNRAKDIAEMLEQQLMKTGTLDTALLAMLTDAYEQLGRSADLRRATTDGADRALMRPKKSDKPNQPGQGFFNVR